MATLTYAGELVTVACWCGIRHAIPSELNRQADGGVTVYCPLGHQWVRRETAADKLERQLADARQREAATRDLLRQEERSHSATRGHLTRVKKRTAAGVCPHPGCKRHFADLERHVAAKHPDLIASIREER